MQSPCSNLLLGKLCSFCVLNSAMLFNQILIYAIEPFNITNSNGRPFIVLLLNGDRTLNINLHYCNVLWQMVGSFFFFPFPSSATLYGYSSRCKIIVGLRAQKYLLRSILGAPQMDCQADGFSVLPTQHQV